MRQHTGNTITKAAELECKHCDKPAEWRWSDADGNEHADICERCMVTIPEYMAAPGWQFELISTLGWDDPAAVHMAERSAKGWRP